MNLTYDHRLNASFLLWLDNLLCGKGGAFSSGSGFFYDTQEVYGGRFSYSSPYRPFLADTSIPGTRVNESTTVKNANIISGVYLDGVFLATGSSGLTGIDYAKGTVYFISGLTYANKPASTRLSGNFVVPSFSIKLTNEPEENLLFETKYDLKPRTNQSVTGLGPSENTFPTIYVKPNGSRNTEYALGGMEESINSLRLIVLADSQYALDGVNSLVRDKTRCVIPLLTGVSEVPFNAFGGYSAGTYNYNTTFTGRYGTANSVFLTDVRVTRLIGTAMDNLRKINPKVFISIIDCDLSSYRHPRA